MTPLPPDPEAIRSAITANDAGVLPGHLVDAITEAVMELLDQWLPDGAE